MAKIDVKIKCPNCKIKGKIIVRRKDSVSHKGKLMEVVNQKKELKFSFFRWYFEKIADEDNLTTLTIILGILTIIVFAIITIRN